MTKRLCSTVSEELYIEFKQVAAIRGGFRKGYTRKALEDALRLFIVHHRKEACNDLCNDEEGHGKGLGLFLHLLGFLVLIELILPV
jgi:hypothetical protein